MVLRKFSLYDIEQFMREAGAERITEDAVIDLEKEMERLAEKISNRAMRYAEHAGRRKLIRKEDIMLTQRNGTQQPMQGASNPSHMSPDNFRRNARITNPAPMKER